MCSTCALLFSLTQGVLKTIFTGVLKKNTELELGITNFNSLSLKTEHNSNPCSVFSQRIKELE